MGRTLFNIIGGVLIIAGIVFFALPHFINSVSSNNTEVLIENFNEDVKADESENELLSKLWNDCVSYNENIAKNGQQIEDPFFYTGASIDLTQYGLENNMFGYIEIPKMNVKLGIFLGATEENMNKGAVHLDNTSMPIGGEDNNCVIAAHRGNGRYGDMFRSIEKLNIGDSVVITNPWGKLNYTVSDIFAIEPDDIDKIRIQKGKDMVTLVTCHPYGSSRYRYIVYCERAGV